MRNQEWHRKISSPSHRVIVCSIFGHPEFARPLYVREKCNTEEAEVLADCGTVQSSADGLRSEAIVLASVLLKVQRFFATTQRKIASAKITNNWGLRWQIKSSLIAFNSNHTSVEEAENETFSSDTFSPNWRQDSSPKGPFCELRVYFDQTSVSDC